MLVGNGGVGTPYQTSGTGAPPGANSGVPAAAPPYAGPYSTPIPGSPLYLQAEAAANKAYEQALALVNQRRSGTLRQYGYLGDIDPKTGTIKNVRVDPNNPYGELQQLLHSSALSSEQAVNDAVGRGIHGGLAHQAEREVQFQHGAESAALGQSLTDALSQLQQEQNADLETRDQALYNAELDAARQAMDELASNGSVNPANDTGLNIPDYGNLSETTAPKPGAASRPGAAPPKSTRYFTYARQARRALKPGQTVHFKKGRGYYAA